MPDGNHPAVPLHAKLGSPPPKPPIAEPIAMLRNVSILRGKTSIEIHIEASAEVMPAVMQLANPERIVIDLAGVSCGGGHNFLVNAGGVEDVRVGLFQSDPPVTRVVVDLTHAHQYELLPAGSTVILAIDVGPTAAIAMRPAAPEAKTAAAIPHALSPAVPVPTPAAGNATGTAPPPSSPSFSSNAIPPAETPAVPHALPSVPAPMPVAGNAAGTTPPPSPSFSSNAIPPAESPAVPHALPPVPGPAPVAGVAAQVPPPPMSPPPSSNAAPPAEITSAPPRTDARSKAPRPAAIEPEPASAAKAPEQTTSPTIPTVSTLPVQTPLSETPPATSGDEDTTPHQAAKSKGPGLVRSLTVAREKDSIAVSIEASKPLRASTSTLSNPDRIVIDLADVRLKRPQRITVNAADVQTVHASLFLVNPLVTRVVVELAHPHAYHLEPSGNSLKLRIETDDVKSAGSQPAR